MKAFFLVAMASLLGTFGCSSASKIPLPATAPATLHSAEATDLAWTALNRLQGTWRATRENGRVITVSYRLISNGSALVETFITPRGTETLSVYHRDGTALMLTHYCAQGNQARLKATRGSQDGVVFEFLDATNVRPGQGIMKQLFFALRGDSFDQESVYEEGGKFETTTLHFVAVQA